MDMAKILDSFHTAEYQYLPALAMPKGDTLVLKLNNPPSFHKPQSVLVVGLPAVQTAEATPDLPVMRAVDPKNILCAQKKPLVLQMVGAPYVFATSYAHDFVFRVQNKAGQSVDIPVTPDPMQGGFLVNEKALAAQSLAGSATGTLHGYWGFEPGRRTEVSASERSPATMDAGFRRPACADRGPQGYGASGRSRGGLRGGVTAKDAGGKTLDATWKAVKPNQIQIDMPLDSEQAGAVSLQVKQVGLEKPDQVPLHTYSEAGRLDSFKLYAGDHQGVLKGTRLDEVATMTVNNVVFSPAAGLTHSGSEDSLVLAAPESAAIELSRGRQGCGQSGVERWTHAGFGIESADSAPQREADE